MFFWCLREKTRLIHIPMILKTKMLKNASFLVSKCDVEEQSSLCFWPQQPVISQKQALCVVELM